MRAEGADRPTGKPKSRCAWAVASGAMNAVSNGDNIFQLPVGKSIPEIRKMELLRAIEGYLNETARI